MSGAAERLRELDAAMTEGHNRTLAKLEPPYFSSREISVLRVALPLIADVVEAAEAIEYQQHEPWSDEYKAIVSSLVALRDHLEGGDVT